MMQIRWMALMAAAGMAAARLVAGAPAATAPPAGSAVDPLAALAQRADVIISCAIFKVTPVEGGVVLETALRGDRGPAILKGTKDFAFWDVFVPAASPAAFTRGDECILFTNADPPKQRLILLPDPGAKSAATAEMNERIGKLSQAEKPLRLFIGTSETTYRMGQPVTLLWRLRNISTHPITVYNGASAFGWDATGVNESGRPAINLYSGRGGSFATYNVKGFQFSKDREGEFVRSAADYRTLAPGEMVERREPIDALVPTGTLNIRMRYTCEDNRLGTKDKITGRLESVPFLNEEATLQVPIQAPDDAFLQSVPQKLQSVDPEQQRSMLFALSADPKAAALPQVRALAHHPWWEIRRLAADALTAPGQPMTPELRDLLYDPNIRVRTEALELCGRQRVGGCGLAALALMLVEMEAADKGVMPRPQGYIWEEQALFRGGDQRIGDLLCARVEAGKDDGYILALLLGIQSQVNRRGGKVSPEEQALVVKTWKESRPQVQGLATEADLKAEMDLCRKKIYNNYALDPGVTAVGDLLKRLNKAATPKPEDVAALVALGKGNVPTTLYLLQNNYQGLESETLYKQYIQWKAVETEDYLIGASCDGSYYAPVAALALDRNRAYPIIAAMLPHSVGAELALAGLGEKRAVPLIMTHWMFNDPWTDNAFVTALTAATGQIYNNFTQWQKWWQDTGSRQDWK